MRIEFDCLGIETLKSQKGGKRSFQVLVGSRARAAGGIR